MQVLLKYIKTVHPQLLVGLEVGHFEGETEGQVLDDLCEGLEEDEQSLFFDVKVDELSRHHL